MVRNVIYGNSCATRLRISKWSVIRRIIERIVTVVTTTTWKISWEPDTSPQDHPTDTNSDDLSFSEHLTSTSPSMNLTSQEIGETEVDFPEEKNFDELSEDKP